MKGYVYISEKHSSIQVTEQDVNEILQNYNGLVGVQVRKSKNSSLQQALFTFTNEPEEINYSVGKYGFATSGDFLYDEEKICERIVNSGDNNHYMSGIGGINTFATFYRSKICF